MARLLGPPLGGLLVGLAGLPSVVALDSASYLLAGLLVAGIASSGLPATGDQAEDSHPPVSGLNRTWGEWRAGLQAVARDRVVVALFVILGLATFADSLNSALIVPFVADVIGGSALAFGWLLTAQGIGGLLGSALVGQVGRRLTPVALIVLGLWSGGALLLVLYNVPSLPLALALVFLAGVTTVGWSVSTQTLLQSTVADVYRGRVFGALGTTNGLLSLCGVGLASALGDLVGLLPVLNASGTLRIVAGVLALVLLRGGGAAWEIRAAGTGQGVPEVDRASDG